MLTSHAQPKGLYVLFLTEMWERFSFYIMRALLILYMTSLEDYGGLGWSNAAALRWYSYYLMIAYMTPIIGGWVADRWLGQRLSILMGGAMMAVGHLLMAVPTLDTFYVALALVALGNGFFKPNLTAILGNLYERNDPRQDGGYAIFYMGINIGALLAGLGGAYLYEMYGFYCGFVCAGAAMAMSLFTFILGHSYLGRIGQIPARASEGSSPPLTRIEWQRLKVIGVLCLALVFFIAAFEQAGGLLNLYANYWTDRKWMGITLPAVLFQSIIPFFVVLLSPLFSWIWMTLGSKSPCASHKIAIGLGLCSVGFALIWALTPADVMQTCEGCHSLWLIPFYAIVTAGEICILPVIWSYVSKLSPKPYASSLMAVALCAIGLGAFFAGQVASFVDQQGPREIFATISAFTAAMAGVMLILTPRLRSWSHGIE